MRLPSKQLIVEEGRQYLKALNPRSRLNRIIEVNQNARIVGLWCAKEMV